MACTCTHPIEDHRDEVGGCEMDECLCLGYEEVGDMEGVWPVKEK